MYLVEQEFNNKKKHIFNVFKDFLKSQICPYKLRYKNNLILNSSIEKQLI